MTETPRDWPQIAIGELLETIIDYRGKTPPKSSSGVTTLTSANVRNGRLDLSKVSYVSQDTYDKWVTRGLPKPGDVLITTEAPVGEVASLPGDQTYLITRRMMALRGKPDKLHNDFLKYSLMYSGNIRRLLGATRGSTVPRVLKTDITNLKLPIPPLSEQKSISQILGTLDDKIELNRQMNATLEAMARAIFKSWFVDFDPVNAKAEGEVPVGMDAETAVLFPDALVETELGPMPEGWEVGSFGEIAQNVRRSVKPEDVADDTPYIGLQHMPRQSISLSEWGDAEEVISNKSQFKEGEFLFGKLRPYFHKVGVAPLDGVCSTDILVIFPKDPKWYGLVLSHISSTALVDYTTAMSSGTKMPRTNWKDMARYEIVIPPAEIAQAFNRIVEPIVKKIKANIFESHTLAELRDTLLPKLISGDVRVGEVGEGERMK